MKRNTQQRRHAIVALVQEHGEVSVDDLTRRFDTSEVTIRKDLALLETSGLLLRRYGGAVALPAEIVSADAEKVSQRKMAIARAAGFAKKLIILDEPTAALGVQETARVEGIIKGLKERQIPLIIISHNLRQVFDLVDRIWVFRQGRIIASLETKKTNPEQIVALITGAISPESVGEHILPANVMRGTQEAALA